MIMKKTRQFDDIKIGEIVRLLRTARYYDNKPRPFWTFGIISSTYLNDFFHVYTPERHGGHEYRIRRDGMNKSGKGAFQIAFRVTPEEMDHPLVKEFLFQKTACEAAKQKLNKTGHSIFLKLENQATNIFQNYPIPEV